MFSTILQQCQTDNNSNMPSRHNSWGTGLCAGGQAECTTLHTVTIARCAMLHNTGFDATHRLGKVE